MSKSDDSNLGLPLLSKHPNHEAQFSTKQKQDNRISEQLHQQSQNEQVFQDESPEIQEGQDQQAWEDQPTRPSNFPRKAQTYIWRAILYIWYRGPLSTFLSAVIGSQAQFLCKRLIENGFPSLQLSLLVSFLALIYSLLASYSLPRKHIFGYPESLPYLLSCGIFGALSNTCYFLSLSYLSLAEAGMVFFLNPIFIIPFSIIFLNEPIGTFTILSFIVAIGGFVLVEKPTFIFGQSDWSNGRLIGLMEGILGAPTAAASYISIAMTGDYENTQVFNTYFYGFSVLSQSIAGVMSLQQFVAPTISQLLQIVVISMLHFGGQLLLTRGFQISKAITVATINYTNVVYGYVYDTIFFNNSPDFYGVLGSDLIAASLFMVNADKKIKLHQQELQAEEQMKKQQDEEQELYGTDETINEAEHEGEDVEANDNVPNLKQQSQYNQKPTEGSTLKQDLDLNLEYHKDLQLGPQQQNRNYINRMLSVTKLDSIIGTSKDAKQQRQDQKQ